MRAHSRLFLYFMVFSFTLPAVAAGEDFVLPYRNENRWVHKNDNEPLVKLMNATRKKAADEFAVVLPDGINEKLYLERLVVLRDILLSRQPAGVVLRQTEGKTPKNTIKVRILEKE